MVPSGLLLVVLEIVYSATDPPIKALRRVIPPMRIGTIAIDLSFIIVMISAYVLLYVVGAFFPRSGAVRCESGSTCHISPTAGATVPGQRSQLHRARRPTVDEQSER